MKTALVILDAQRIYTDSNSELYCDQANNTLTRINQLIAHSEKEGSSIVLVRHIHKPDGSDLGRMFDYAGPVEEFNFKADTREVEYAPRLRKPRNSIEIVKSRYSAFAGTDLDDTLRRLGVGRIVICGFMTNFCCDSTAREAHDRDYFVDFIVDATGTPGIDGMNQSKLRRVVGQLLAEGYAEVFTTKEYLARRQRKAQKASA